MNHLKVETHILFIPRSFSDHTETTIIQSVEKTVEMLQCSSLMKFVHARSFTIDEIYDFQAALSQSAS